MMKVPSRAALDELRGIKKEPAPAPAPAQPDPPPAPAASPVIEQALAQLTSHMQQIATMAAQAHAGVAALASRSEQVMEAEIRRDTQGRMERIVITRKK